ncbi:MAG: hypothetical protein JW780_05330 [Clostridiales bacterium]|nr:hypothetical protein [Clostridiales bacterium]
MLPSNGSYTPENNPIMSPSTRERVRVFFLFLATTLISFFFCCFHSSFYRFPIYPDANAYMGVARAIGHHIIYKDGGGSVVFPKTNIEYCAEVANDHWILHGDGSSPTIISLFGMEMGLSQRCNTYPQNRYFYAPNVELNINAGILDEQMKYIETGSVDFIFTNSTMDVTDQIARINPSYRLICKRLSDNDVKYSYRVYAKDRTGGEP